MLPGAARTPQRAAAQPGRQPRPPRGRHAPRTAAVGRGRPALAHVAATGACSAAKGGTLPTQQGRRRREPPHLGRGAGTRAVKKSRAAALPGGDSPPRLPFPDILPVAAGPAVADLLALFRLVRRVVDVHQVAVLHVIQAHLSLCLRYCAPK